MRLRPDRETPTDLTAHHLDIRQFLLGLHAHLVCKLEVVASRQSFEAPDGSGLLSVQSQCRVRGDLYPTLLLVSVRRLQPALAARFGFLEERLGHESERIILLRLVEPVERNGRLSAKVVLCLCQGHELARGRSHSRSSGRVAQLELREASVRCDNHITGNAEPFQLRLDRLLALVEQRACCFVSPLFKALGELLVLVIELRADVVQPYYEVVVQSRPRVAGQDTKEGARIRTEVSEAADEL